MRRDSVTHDNVENKHISHYLVILGKSHEFVSDGCKHLPGGAAGLYGVGLHIEEGACHIQWQDGYGLE